MTALLVPGAIVAHKFVLSQWITAPTVQASVVSFGSSKTPVVFMATVLPARAVGGGDAAQGADLEEAARGHVRGCDDVERVARLDEVLHEGCSPGSLPAPRPPKSIAAPAGLHRSPSEAYSG